MLSRNTIDVGMTQRRRVSTFFAAALQAGSNYSPPHRDGARKGDHGGQSAGSGCGGAGGAGGGAGGTGAA